MPHSYPRARWALRTALLLAPIGTTLAQSPVITSVIPMANARAAARTSPVTINFSQPLTAASAGAMKVFSSQRGGLRSRGTTPAVVSGSALSFAPTAYPFMPGETVQYTVTTAAAGSGGALAAGRVGQFTAAVGGTGRGNFQSSTDLMMGGSPTGLAVGDVNNDGQLDLLTAVVGSSGHGVKVLLNYGLGTLVSTQYVYSTVRTGRIKLQDVDGDGDLDLLIARLGTNNFPGNTVGVCLNNGGTFGQIQTVAVDNNPYALQVADVDGDGDMDLLVACEAYGGSNGSTPGSVNIRLNDGSGTFGGTYSVAVGVAPLDLAVGDIDGDGDVDLAVANSIGTVSLRLNTGNGTFGGNQELGFRANPGGVALSDVDGDGDLDLLVVTSANNTLNVRLNDGSGVFSGTQSVSVGINPTTLVVGDVDGDGDLDVAVSSYAIPASVAVRLNDGSGTFGGGADYLGGDTPISLALADLDGDGDLDLMTGNYGTNTVTVRMNTAIGLATAASHSPAALALFPNPAHGAASITGATPNAPLTVLDALGRVRLTATADATGAARLVLPEGLPAGVYLVRSGGLVRRLVVE